MTHNLSDSQVLNMSCHSPTKKRKTRRGNATRFWSLKKSFLNHDRYYPIYIRYSHTDVPVFEYATCAITWQLSRYLRDHVKTTNFEYPSWIRYIGTIASSELKNWVKKIWLILQMRTPSWRRNFFNMLNFISFQRVLLYQAVMVLFQKKSFYSVSLH